MAGSTYQMDSNAEVFKRVGNGGIVTDEAFHKTLCQGNVAVGC